MLPQDYYHQVFKGLEKCFHHYDYFIATGNELIAEGYDPAFPALAAPLDQLAHYTRERALQVHLPVIGKKSQSVLMPIDFEIFLGDDNYRLYSDKDTQKEYFKQIVPVADFIEQIFRSRGMPYLLDYTPSGGHFLFQNQFGDRATQALVGIGYLEEDLIKACRYIDPNDLRRRSGVALDAARVFSGLGKLNEYIALLTMEAFRDNETKGFYPVTISDSLDRCINLDNTWSEGSPFMRSIRSPFSLHKKNQEKYGYYHQPPLVDVIGSIFDGRTVELQNEMDLILDCMWDLEQAAAHAQSASGTIPRSNDTLIDFIGEYQRSDLYAFHQDFDREPDLPRGRALTEAKNETDIPDWAREILYDPNPRALQPNQLIGFVYDLCIRANWKPKYIGNVLRDLYQDPVHGWTQDFFRYPSEEKANYWARAYSAVALWRTGRLKIPAMPVKTSKNTNSGN